MPLSPEGVGPAARFESELEQGRFTIQLCGACGRHVFYPRALCPACGGENLTSKEAGGAGTVYSTTTIRQKEEDGGDYNVSIIELDEGPRMMSRVETADGQTVEIGATVRAHIVRQDGKPIVVFRIPSGPGLET